MAILDTVYVELIEAVRVYVLAEVEKKGENLFLIVKNDQFDPEDNSSLFKFLPGDTVFCKLQIRENVSGKMQEILVADSLVSSIHPDRNLFALKFLIVDKEGDLTDEQIIYFQDDINRLKKEIAIHRNSGEKSFHPAILRWFDRFYSLV